MKSTLLVWRVVGAWLLLAATCVVSFALEGDLKLSQFAHVAWGANEGAPSGIQALAQTADGYLWVGSPEGLFRFDGVTFERYQAQSEPPLPGGDVVALLALPNGDLWIGFFSGDISLLRKGHAVNYGKRDGTPKGYIHCLVQDQSGDLWADSEYGLLRLENNRWREIESSWNFPRTSARALYVDRSGTLWVATHDSVMFLPKGTRRFVPTGIHVGQVSQIVQAPNGKLWMAETTRSVRPVPLQSKLPPSDETEIRVGSARILFTARGDLWVTTLGDGLRHVSDPAKLTGKQDRLSQSIEAYTSNDGLSSEYVRSILQDRDGNIWVGTERGLDRFRANAPNMSRGLSRDPQARPAFIQSIVADGRSYLRGADLRLPAGTKNLQINYTSVNLEAPWQVHFRYKLDGVDMQWQDAGSRRTAFYTNLGPGRYRFDVIAGDLDGAWSAHAAVVRFAIQPLWFQNRAVQVVGAVFALLLLWSAHRFRLRQLEREFSLTVGTRVDERTRIARELHDTLLQSFHGLMFQFQAARNMLPRTPDFAMQTLDEAILATEQALAEGRDAIRDLRPQAAAQQDLAELLTQAGNELACVQGDEETHPDFRVVVEGAPRTLSPLLRDEIHRIGREVIRNAFRHAHAKRIEVEIRYDDHQLRLRIRDNGKGIAGEVLASTGHPGHWGLPGIRERSEKMGARLEFWSEAAAGTEVELSIPAALAYEKPQKGYRIPRFPWGGRSDRHR